MPRITALKRLQKRLERHPNPVRCAMCPKWMRSRDYERHCTLEHGLDAKLACVWCQGQETWRRGDKSRKVDHLLQCWQKFLAVGMGREARPPLPEARPPEESGPIVPFDRTPLCESGQWFGRTPLLPRELYTETLSPIDLKPLAVRYDDASLNVAAACVQRYLQTPGDEWHHVMVRAVAMPVFREVLEEDAGRSRTLPFFCWCDGGTQEEPLYRQHRHMVMITPKGHFTQVWRKVRPEKQLPRHLKCRDSKEITSAIHLVHTLGYLSQRPSICLFTGSRVERNNHFLIHRTLPVDYKLPLTLLWDGGCLELLSQTYGHWDPNHLLSAPMTFREGQWHIRVRDLPDLPRRRVLPVDATFQPTSRETRWWLHLAQNERQYFEKSLETSPPVLFFEAVGDAWWTPSRFQQKCLQFMKPNYDRTVALEQKLKAERERNGALEQESKALQQELKAERERNGALEQESKAMQQELKAERDRNEALEQEKHEAKTKAMQQELKAERDRNGALEQELKAVWERIRELEQERTAGGEVHVEGYGFQIRISKEKISR